MKISRKKFIRKLGSTGLIGTLGLPQLIWAANMQEPSTYMSTDKGLTILFQGDSITDGNRSRNNDWNHVMGHGYAYLVASRLWFDYVNQNLMFYNRGISGNKVQDLDNRWQKDTLDLKPDVLSILIGVNDVGQISTNQYSIEKWKETYIRVLDRTKETLPNTKIILCEPFILPFNWAEDMAESYQIVISKMQEIVRQLAKVYHAVFVGLQQPFIDACEKAPANYWIWDGIHPMPAGHELIARLWINNAKKALEFIEE